LGICRLAYTFLQILNVLGGEGDADAVELQLGGILDAKLSLEASVHRRRRHGVPALYGKRGIRSVARGGGATATRVFASGGFRGYLYYH
jgi:hypothetical protein